MTPPAVPPARAARGAGLPAGLRRVAIFAIVMAGLVSVGSINEASGLLHAQRGTGAPPAVLTPSDPAAAATQKAFAEAFQGALLAHRDLRVLLLMVQMFACALCVGAALRLLKPRGLPREGMRSLLAASALGAAFVRTAEGAQHLAAVQSGLRAAMPHMLEHLAKVDPATGPLNDVVARGLHLLTLGASAGITLVFAGSLLFVGQYFRSARVREAVRADDLRTQRG